MEGKKYFKILSPVLLALFLGLSLVSFTSAKAADTSMYFTPSSGSYAIGRNISISVFVASSDRAVNAYDGQIDFPQDILEVTSLSKSGSIVSLWVQEPAFSNSDGSITFAGITLNPGFKGQAGKILTINFKARAAGQAHLVFSAGSVLANDGYGTNVLTSLGDANLIVLAGGPPTSVAPEATLPTEKVGLPLAPKISSPTHPNPEKWYSKSNPQFTWALEPGTTGVNFLADHESLTNPGAKSDGLMKSYTYQDVENGTWYFHLRLRNAQGWGGISHFRFQIDTEKPDSFVIKPIPGDDPIAPTAKFIFIATDKVSGIDFYEVKVDGQEAQIWHDDGQHLYQTPVLEPGKHSLFVKAIDRAGNFLMNSVDFTIAALEPPVFVDYPKELSSGNILVVKGKTYPEVQVVVYMQRESNEPTSQQITSDADGNFTFVAGEKLPDGVYKIWAEAINKKGARSGLSEKITIIVRPSAFLRIGSLAVSIFSVINPLIALFLLLLFLLWYSWRKFSAFKKKLRKDVHEAEVVLHEVFNVLDENIWKRIKSLEKIKTKRQLTTEEEKIIGQLKQDLIIAEKVLGKEIEDIEKEVR